MNQRLDKPPPLSGISPDLPCPILATSHGNYSEL